MKKLLLILCFCNTLGSLAAPIAESKKVIHIVNKLSFGAQAQDLNYVRQIGIENYIKAQLSPGSIPENPELLQELAKLKTLQMPRTELIKQFERQPRAEQKQIRKNQQTPNKASQAELKQIQKQLNIPLEEAKHARLARALKSNRQLQEVMLNFWFNHFNVYHRKGFIRHFIGLYEEKTIRPLALGRFRTLLGAVAKDPAMLVYLDNWQNEIPNGKKGINENYARELMELHTLGVNGGYTQKDVVSLAYILTGWGLKHGRQNPEFGFNAAKHDSKDKVLIGKTIKGGGPEEVEQALDLLAAHPSTAKFLSFKLAQYFVADNPPPTLVQRMSESYLKSNGHIATVLNTMFHSPEFWDEAAYRHKYKTPYQYVVSALRALNAPVSSWQMASATIDELGMPLYGQITPDGYKYTEEAWLASDSMVKRLGATTKLVKKQFKDGHTINPQNLMNSLGNDFSSKTKTVVEQAQTPPAQIQLILGSPEFMYY